MRPVLLACAACLACGTVLTGLRPARAFDDAAFCADKTELAESGQLEPAAWPDEYMRDEGVTVRCSMRMIEFRRYLDMAPGDLDNDWRRREKARWNAAHCDDPEWHEAIRNGWTVASTLVTAAGERIWFAASCR